MEDNGGHDGAVKLTKSQKKNRRKALNKKMKKNLESLDKPEDTENAKSSVTALSSNNSLGTTAIVDQKTTVSAVAATGDGKCSNSGTENDKETGAANLTKGQLKKRRKLAKKKLKALTGGQTKNLALGCVEAHAKMIAEKGSGTGIVHFNNISVSSLPKKSDSSLGTTAIVDHKMTVSTVTATGDGKCSNSETENDKENGAANLTKGQLKKRRKLAEKKLKAMTGGQTKIPALGCVETHDKLIAAEGSGTGKVFEATGGEMVPPVVTMVPKGELHTEVGNGNTATVNSASKKRKRQKNENVFSASGDIMKTCDKVIEEKGLGTSKSVEAISSEIVTGKNTIPDALMVSNVEEHAEVANGKAATGNPASKKKRKRGKMSKNPVLGEVTMICDNRLENVIAENGLGITKSIEATSSEMVTGKNAIPDLSMMSKVQEHTEIANGKTATDYPASKKISENTNQPLVEIMITCDNTQEKVMAENGPDITKSVEAISSEMVTGKTAIPDASMVSKVEEHIEVASGKTGPGTAATDTTASKKRKRRKLKKKGLTSDGILSIGESAQDTVIVNKVSGTNKPLEALSSESKREDLPELFGDEKGPKTITGDAESTMLKTVGCTKVSNSEIGSTGTTTTAQDLPLPKKTPRQRKKQKSVALNTINNKEVKQITQVATLGKKLVIFDVNGLLADVVLSGPKDVKADVVIKRRAIFKRPFLDDFLSFCFERFNVGIWSSRTKPVLDPVVDFLLGDLKNKLLFLWDASKCTNSGLRTPEDRHKPIVFKDLRKIWDKKDTENRWVKGTFNESNTLLLDDSPYKALLNPKHSGIYPASYTYKNKDDDFLGPKGELRIYLEGLVAADSVKSYVEQHPFGQDDIDEKSPHWFYYARALKGQNR
uniref:uncharacterized protein LOC122588108 n=1 Tax=Erigeron canadensis TaxID=72917 RepID=UPI001CB972E2|nr:uncharacterized protein LOC122588108 [Erigeron canadensis]